MALPPENEARETELSQLLDENEQLRTLLESALEENGRLGEDRDRLLHRATVLTRTLRELPGTRPPQPTLDPEEKETKQSQVDEELRVAMEELQMVAEELEVANAGLQRANDELEECVRTRTRELMTANADLRRTELRLNTLIEGVPQLVWRAVDGGNWTWCSSQWIKLTGLSQEDSREMGWLNAFHPDDRAAAQMTWEDSQSEGTLSFEGRIYDVARETYRYFQTQASPVRTPDGMLLEWLGTCTDVDDIIRLQEQQSVLVTELQHRTRNLMAIVYAVMMRTLKRSRTLDEFRHCINDRLSALSRVQSLLSRRGAQRVAFDTLLREELSAHLDLGSAEGTAQVSIDGPSDVPLESSLVQTFALALHELATNAVKYGALSVPDGHLTVMWKVVHDGGKPRLYVDWRESGVPDMPTLETAPQGGGYGRELIERALPYQLGATTSYDFTSDGVHCTIMVGVAAGNLTGERVHA